MKLEQKIKSLVKGMLALMRVRLLDPIEVYFLPESLEVYPIVSKSACSSIKLILIKRFLPDYQAEFPGVHHIDVRALTKGSIEQLYFYSRRKYLQFIRQKQLHLVIREPAERVYSCYKDVTTAKNTLYLYPAHLNWLLVFKPNMAIDAFLKKVAAIDDSLADRHFRSQSFFLPPDEDTAQTELHLYTLQSFMRLKAEEGRTEVRIGRSTKPHNKADLQHLKNSRHFTERYTADITLYAQLSKR